MNVVGMRKLNSKIVLFMMFVISELCVILLFYNKPYFSNEVNIINKNYNKIVFYNLNKGHEIEQKFITDYSYIKTLSLFVVNIKPDMENFNLELLDRSKKVIYSYSCQAEELDAGLFNSFDINSKITPNQEYTIRLTYDGNSDNDYLGIMMLPAEKNIPQIKECTYAGESAEHTLAIEGQFAEVPSETGMLLTIGIVAILYAVVWPEKKRDEN